MGGNKRFYNKNLVSLDISEHEQALLDDIIRYATETYIESVSGEPRSCPPAGEVTRDPALDYFDFGLNLLAGGMDAVNTKELMEARYQVLTAASGFAAGAGNTWLRLSFVKNAIELLQEDVLRYFRFIGQVASDNVPLESYYDALNERGMFGK